MHPAPVLEEATGAPEANVIIAAVAKSQPAPEQAVIADANGAGKEAAVHPDQPAGVQHVEPSVEGAEENQEITRPEAPSDETVVARLRELLREVDLSVTSEKMLRRKLEAELKCDLSSKKALVRSEVVAYLDAQEAGGVDDNDAAGEEDSGDDEGGAPSRKRSRAASSRFGEQLSEAMQAFLGVESCPRTQVVKRLWEYIKANELQDPKDRRRILLDDKMKTIFPGKSVTMFNMQKHLSKHVFIDDSIQEASDDGEEEDDDDSPPAKQAKRSKSQPKSRRFSEGGPAKPNGFTKPVRLSPQLAAWMGKPEASRPEITKHLWAYIKERNLQDPANKTFVVSDATLKELTGEAKFKAFSFSKFIKDHILGYA